MRASRLAVAVSILICPIGTDAGHCDHANMRG
jgi:hypothetical protein